MSLCCICGVNLYEHHVPELIGCLKFLNKQIESCWYQLENSAKTLTLEVERSKAISTLSTTSINLNQRVTDIENIIRKNGYAYDNTIDEIMKLLRNVK